MGIGWGLMGKKGMVLNMHFGKITGLFWKTDILKDNLEWINKTSIVFKVSKEYSNDGRDG